MLMTPDYSTPSYKSYQKAYHRLTLFITLTQIRNKKQLTYETRNSNQMCHRTTQHMSEV